MVKLGINVDHVATLRQARREGFPDPVALALDAVKGGAEGITAHLREDRRHIQEEDLYRLKNDVAVPFNLEMANSETIVKIAVDLKPAWTCLVPEKRQELTTEGGLDLKSHFESLKKTVQILHKNGIHISLFIDPTSDNVQRAKSLGVDAIEIHTGSYARAWSKFKQEASVRQLPYDISPNVKSEVGRIIRTAEEGKACGLLVNAGHGLDYENVKYLIKEFPFHEFNIGFSIVARALMIGMEAAVRDMVEILKGTLCVES